MVFCGGTEGGAGCRLVVSEGRLVAGGVGHGADIDSAVDGAGVDEPGAADGVGDKVAGLRRSIDTRYGLPFLSTRKVLSPASKTL